MGTPSAPLTTKNSEASRRHHDDQPVRPDLGKHEFVRLQRHHQEMLERSVLAFPQHRRAGQEDREY